MGSGLGVGRSCRRETGRDQFGVRRGGWWRWWLTWPAKRRRGICASAPTADSEQRTAKVEETALEGLPGRLYKPMPRGHPDGHSACTLSATKQIQRSNIPASQLQTKLLIHSSIMSPCNCATCSCKGDCNSCGCGSCSH